MAAGDVEMPISCIKKNKRGQVVHQNKKLNIVDLYKKLKEADPRISYKETIDRLSEETGIGKSSIKHIIAEYNKTGYASETIVKRRRLSFRDKIEELEKNAIRQKLHDFYRNNELPTADKLMQAINDDDDLPQLKRSTFHKLLQELNFTFAKCQRNSILTEKEDLVVCRRNYLRSIQRYRVDGRSIYYLDETWIDAGDVAMKLQKSTTVRSKKNPSPRDLTARATVSSSSKGKRLIVLHIGSAAGFVPGGLSFFESKKNAADYHDELNGDTFLEWFKKVLPMLDENCVIVMDNAPYHSVKIENVPNSLWKKGDIVEWLQRKGKEVDETMVKAELLHIVGLEKDKFDKYAIDELAKENNRKVLRLPPYHCELNPIEMAWSVVKDYVETNNKTSEIQDIKRLLEEGIARVTDQDWRNFIRHTIEEEKNFWEIDGIADRLLDYTEPLMIDVNAVSEFETDDSD